MKLETRIVRKSSLKKELLMIFLWPYWKTSRKIQAYVRVRHMKLFFNQHTYKTSKLVIFWLYRCVVVFHTIGESKEIMKVAIELPVMTLGLFPLYDQHQKLSYVSYFKATYRNTECHGAEESFLRPKFSEFLLESLRVMKGLLFFK